MRLKVVFPILVCGALALASLFVVRSHLRSGASTEGAHNGGDDPSLGGAISGAGSSRRPAAPPLLPAAASRRVYTANRGQSPAVGDALTPEQQQDAVNERIVQLSELGAKGDSASTGVLLAEVNNGNADIRRAALDALMQSGNRDAIPALQQLAEGSVDPQQKRDLAEAIEFLTLPSISEVFATRGPVAQPSVQVPRRTAFGRR